MNASIPPEKIAEAFGKVPRPLREFIAEGELTATVQDIAARYKLHVDATGVLVQLMTMVLLGFINPANLPQELSSRVGLSSADVPEFIKELNTNIFIPLQKKVREFGEEPSHEERIRAAELEDQSVSAAPTAPKSAPVNPQATSQVPVMQVVEMPSAQAAPSPIYNPAPAPAPQPSYNLISQQQPVSAEPSPIAVLEPAMPAMRTMHSDMEALQHPIQNVSSMQAMPARSFQTSSVPFTSAPVAPVPVIHPSVPVSNMPSQPVFTAPQPTSAPQSSLPTANIPYSTDPYREPPV